MTAERNEPAIRPLSVLGIGEEEERIYRWLLAHPGATMQEAARGLGLGPGRVQRALAILEAQGLVTHTPQRPSRYVPAAPDIALRAHLLRRRKELQRAEDAIEELREHAATFKQQDAPEPLVELITSRETEYQVFEQMQLTAEEEVLTLARMPMRLTRLEDVSEQDAQRQARVRGVRYRSIVDSEFLDASSGAVHKTWADMQAGEEVRVLSRLPFKMVLADRRIGLIPLNLQKSGSPALLVRSSALIDALCALFEILWERAGPVSPSASDGLEADPADRLLAEDARELLSLMASGLNDKTIAHELGLSMRTLSRRISQLMEDLDARTRFQAGWLSAVRYANAGAVESGFGVSR